MNPVNQSIRQAIITQSEELSQNIAARIYNIPLDLWKMVGSEGREKCVRDINYHLSFLTEAIALESPLLFEDYIAWVRILFDNLQLSPNTMHNTLEAIQFILHENFQAVPESSTLIDEYLQIGFEVLTREPKSPPVFVHESQPMGELAQEYLDALLRGERLTASKLIMDASARGASVEDLYLNVFQKVQYEVGHRWQTKQINIVQEHFCTFVTQLSMSQLTPQVIKTKRINRRLVATCIDRDLHEVGIRMVSDFFEMSGWDTYFLGANTPSEIILKTLEDRRPDILAISATLTIHLGAIGELISKVRSTETGKHVKILVGGYPFNVAEGLWQTIGADGYGRDAQHALDIANQLIRSD